MGLNLADFQGGTVTTALINALIAAVTKAYGVRSMKANDQTITSDTGLHNDGELSVPIAVSTTYTIEARLYVLGAAAGDIKVALAFPTGATVLTFGGMSIITGSVGVSTSADMEAHAIVGQTTSPTGTLAFGVPDTNGIMIILSATVTTTSTAGALTLQWAQNASSGTGTTVKAGSWLRAYPE